MNKYLLEVQARQTGAIGIPDDLQIEKEADSSHNAYVQVRDALYNNGYESVLVKAIKMQSPFTLKFTIVVPPDLYLEGV